MEKEKNYIENLLDRMDNTENKYKACKNKLTKILRVNKRHITVQ